MTSSKSTHIPSVEVMEQLYLIDKVPMKDIASAWGVVPDYARKLIRAAGIPARDMHGAPSLQKSRTRIKGFTQPTQQQFQIILGSILGDGFLSNPKRKGANSFTDSALKMIHSSKQLDYLTWKHSQLADISCPIYSRLSSDGGVRVSFQTHAHPYFTHLRSIWYPSGTKIVNLEELNEIDELGLAIWFMDDGTQGISKGSPYGFFCTDGFSYIEQFLIQGFLAHRFKIDTSVTTNGNGRWRIRVKAAGMRRLCKLIEPYIIPSMSYKLNC